MDTYVAAAEGDQRQAEDRDRGEPTGERHGEPGSMPGSSTDPPPEPNGATPQETVLPEDEPAGQEDPIVDMQPRSPGKQRALKRSNAATYSPSSIPAAKASRMKANSAADADAPMAGYDGPGPETAGDAVEDATSETRSIDSDLLSVDRLIAARAILGSDMMDCISDETAKIIASECHKLLSVDIMEVYSPKRVVELCSKHGLNPGASLDLTNGYDFDDPQDRRRAWKIVEKDKPLLLVGSPPCTYFFQFLTN